MNPQIAVAPGRKGWGNRVNGRGLRSPEVEWKDEIGLSVQQPVVFGTGSAARVHEVSPAGWDTAAPVDVHCPADSLRLALLRQAGITIHLKTTCVAHTLQTSAPGICAIASTCAGGIICMWAETRIKFPILFQMDCQMSRNPRQSSKISRLHPDRIARWKKQKYPRKLRW